VSLFAAEDPFAAFAPCAPGVRLAWTAAAVLSRFDAEPAAAEPASLTPGADVPAGVVSRAWDFPGPAVRLQHAGRTPATATIARGGNYQKIIARLLSMLALLGLGLASLGVYGVIARTVAQRRGEFGIRLALGARPRDITRLVLTSGAKLAVVGSALGLAGSFGVTRLIVAGFPGLQTSTGPVLAGVALLLLGVAQIAGYLPARSASRVSPTEALRAE